MKNRATYLSIPYLVWSLIFTVLPLILVFLFAVFRREGGHYVFTTEYITQLVEGREDIFAALGRSLKLSAIATFICILLGYPMAYILANSRSRHKNLYSTLIILPMWMNFLVRTYALMILLGQNGPFNALLGLIGIAPVQFMYTEGAIVIGMVFNYLPFMVLPIHSVLTKIDPKLIEAAQDLGANRYKVFSRVIFPLSLGGVISGIEMTFIPSITTFALSQLLGGSKTLLIGNMIERQFVETSNWGFGSLLSVIVVVIVLICMGISSYFGTGNKEEGGSLLG